MRALLKTAAASPKLADKQELFCREYLVDLNATQAAIRVGYGKKSAKVQGSRLLTNVNVAARISELKLEQEKRLEITADRVLQEWGKIAFSNMLDYVTVQPDGSAVVDLSAMSRAQAAAVQEITVDEYQEAGGKDARQVKRVRIKLADKKGALDSIAKHKGMFLNKEIDTAGFQVVIRSVLDPKP